jgi:hypothetical protein
VEAPMLGDQAYSIGMPVRDGNFEFVVNGIERASVVSDPEFPDLQKEHQGEYVMVKMQVTNVGAEPQTFFASFNTRSPTGPPSSRPTTKRGSTWAPIRSPSSCTAGSSLRA